MGAGNLEKSSRARSPRCRAIAEQSGRPVPRPGSLRRCRATLQAGTGDPGESARPRSPRCRAIAEQFGRPVQRPGSPRRCRAALQAGAGVNTRAEGEYSQFLDAFCLGLKEFGSARFCAGACDQRRIDRAEWRGHGYYGRIMTTELQPPAPLPIHSRAGWFKAPGHTSGAIFAAKLMQSAEPLSRLPNNTSALLVRLLRACRDRIAALPVPVRVCESAR